MGAHTWNIIGLVLVMVGVIVLFAFGMPYRVRSGGAINLIFNERKREEAYGGFPRQWGIPEPRQFL